MLVFLPYPRSANIYAANQNPLNLNHNVLYKLLNYLPKPLSVGLSTQSEEEQSRPCWRKTIGLVVIRLVYLLPNCFER
jgi:hypothetical protein